MVDIATFSGIYPLNESAQDDPLPKLVLQAVRDPGDIVEYLIKGSLASFYWNIKRYIRLGRSSYPHGLPVITYNANVKSDSEVRDTLSSVIGTEVGEPVNIIEYFYSDLDSGFFVNVYLQNTYQWRELTNDITLSNGNAGFYIGYEITAVDGIGYYEVRLEDSVTGEILIDIVPKVNTEVAYVHSIYQEKSIPTPNDIQFYYYETGTNVHPGLENIYEESLPLKEVLPIISLKNDGKFSNSDNGSRLDVATTRILDSIIIDHDVFISDLKANPDNESIDDAFIEFNVSIYDSDPLVKQYLFNFFEAFHNKSATNNDPSYIRSAFLDEVATWDFASSSRSFNTGIIGEEGDVVTSWVADEDYPSFRPVQTQNASEYYKYIGFGKWTHWWRGGLQNGTSTRESKYTISKQTGPDTYTTLEFIALTKRTIYDGKYDQGYHGAGAIFYIGKTDKDGVLDPEINFSVQIFYHLLPKSSPRKKGDLLFKAMNMTIFSIVESTPPWWTGLVFFIIVVLIVVLPVIAPVLAPVLVFIGATIVSLQVALIISFIIQLVLFIVGTISPEAARILGLILIVATLGKSVVSTVSNTVLYTIDVVLKLVDLIVNITKTALYYESKSLYLDYQEESDALDDEAKAIREAEERMGFGEAANPLDYKTRARFIIPIESPGHFYHRTIHVGNLAGISLSTVGNFVGTMLTLPEPEQSLYRGIS